MLSTKLNSTEGRVTGTKLGKVVAVLTPQEIVDFFPGDHFEKLRQLVDDLVMIDPTELSESDYDSLLASHDPEILLACWKTPTLQEKKPPNLRYVCYLAGSVRKLVSRRQIEEGLLVTNWGSSISRTIAECALLMVLSCLRKTNGWTMDMHLHGAWKDASTRAYSLFDRRVGIHGFGRISQCLVELMRPFGCHISTLSPSVPDALLEEHGVERSDSLEDLFSGSEIIVELAALTPKSRHMVQEKHLRMIPDPGVFVNVGRGAVVEPEGLLAVAREGRLQIALDVFEEEPLPAGSPLRGLKNVMLLPHLAGPTYDRRRDSGELALAHLAAYARGEKLEAAVSPQGYDQAT